MDDDSLATRVAQRIQQRIGPAYGRGADLTRELGKSRGWLSNIFAGRQKVRLDDLDPIASFLGVDPCDLVEDDVRAVVRLTPREQEIVRVYRLLPRAQKVQLSELIRWIVRQVPTPRGSYERLRSRAHNMAPRP